MRLPSFLSSTAGYARYAWAVLAYNVATSAWGAYVRASGSGAGCGNHWPLCNGEVVPRSPTVELLIELTHRSTAGIATILVVGLLVWAMKAFPRGHAVRAGAVASVAMIACEAVMGALLVKLGLVKDDASPARAAAMGLHLVITFFLLAALAAAAYPAKWPAPSPASRPRSPVMTTLGVPFALLIAAATTGAIAALGDTLFRATTIAQGFAQDAAATAHVFLRLRTLHPLFAGLAAITVLGGCSAVVTIRRSPAVVRAARAVRVTLVLQIVAGVLNLLLLAPIAMQIVHLVLADALWVSLVVLLLAATGEGRQEESQGASRSLASPAV